MTDRAIASIRVGKRIRRDLGDLKSLAANIDALGLLHPITITPEGKLLAGERRLLACKMLGWKKVPVTIFEESHMKIDHKALALLPFELQAEIAENLFRKDWLPSEMEAMRRRCESIIAAEAKARQAAAGPASGKGAKATGGGKVSTTDSGKTRDKIGALFRTSGRTLAKVTAIVDAAEGDPKRFGGLVEEMDRSGAVNGAYRKLRQALDVDRVSALKPAAGKFRTLIIDPPWEYDTAVAGRVHGGYASMSMEKLMALPVPQWAEDDAHLYLWVTNAMIAKACALVEAWQFDLKTMLTWVKPKFGLGNYFRGQSEHVIFAVRGSLAIKAHNISTVFNAPTGAHSAKPEIFYEIVRRASFPPYGEAFQCTVRKGFVNISRERTHRAVPTSEATEGER